MVTFPGMLLSRRAAVLTATVLLLSLLVLLGGWQTSAPPPLQTKLTGTEPHEITLSDASALTRNFRKTADSGSVYAEAFGKDAVVGMLGGSTCVGLRIYYGRKSDGSPALVLVGVDSAGADLAGGKILETGFPCPPVCDLASPLAR